MKKLGIIYQYSLKREKVSDIADNILSSSPEDAVQFLRSIGLHEQEQECLIAIALDSRNNIKGYYNVTRGLVNRTMAHPREFFRYAVINNSTSLIMAHNHPSGDPTPSLTDIQLTDEICKAGEILGIQLIDHIIIGDENYFSFAEEDMLKEKSNNKSRIAG